MMDLTFLIPTRIETEDRLRNIISSVSYLLRHIPAKVIVKEVSNHPTFKFRAISEIRKYADTSNLTYLYEETEEPLFCKSKVLNDLIVAADTKVVANYDADCILPLESYHYAYNAINDNQADVVYPYGCGVYQWRAEYNQDIYEEFVNRLDVSVLEVFQQPAIFLAYVYYCARYYSCRGGGSVVSVLLQGQYADTNMFFLVF